MGELINVLIGIGVLILGIPIGTYLANITREELGSGQRYFKLLIILSLAIGVIGLIVGNDALLFSMFFIAIVTSRSLRKK